MAEIRTYAAQARSTDTFGRVLAQARQHHLVVDGPTWNGCPGEAITPGELFLAGVAACAVELLGVVARDEGLPVPAARVEVRGEVDPTRPVRSDLTVFNRVDLRFEVRGVVREEAELLVERFERR